MTIAKKINLLIKIFLTLLVLLVTNNSLAHNINYALAKAPGTEIAWYYTTLGFTHIIPSGVDHILFVAGLCLLGTNIKSIIWQATSFTVAHSITLVLSLKNIIVAPSTFVEPIIALSILFIAVENLILGKLKPWRIAIVFLFGLVHGMGFASVLNEIGLPPNRFFSPLLYFNLGVEIGQIAIISTLFILLIIPFRKKSWYKKVIIYPLSIAIALVATYWTIERLFA